MSTISAVNVTAWTPEKVSMWIKGLDDYLAQYAGNFINAQITGVQLLMMTNDDLESIGITKVGHQELLLNAINLMQTLSAGLEQETLLYKALHLSCRARSLYCELNAVSQKALSDVRWLSSIDKCRHLFLVVLFGASEIAGAVKEISVMFNKIPFDKNDRYTESQNQLIDLGLMLLSACQDETVISKLETIMSLCRHIWDLCEFLITESVDPLAIHSSSLELVTVHKKTDEDLGLDLQVSSNGIHTVGRVTPGSNASACKKIEEGNEIVYVNGHTVVGWSQQNVVSAFKENQKDVTLLLKKYPHHMSLAGFQKKPKAYKELPKLNIGPKLRRSYGKPISNLPNRDSAVSADSLPVHLNPLLDENAFDNEVFHSTITSTSSLRFSNVETHLRHATVGGETPSMIRSPLSAMDLATSRSSTRTSSRPKSLFRQSEPQDVLNRFPVDVDQRDLKVTVDDAPVKTQQSLNSSSSSVNISKTCNKRSPSQSKAVVQVSPTNRTSSRDLDTFDYQIGSASDAVSSFSPHLNSPLSKNTGLLLHNTLAGYGDCGTSPQLLSMLRIDSTKRPRSEQERFFGFGSVSSLDTDSKTGTFSPSITNSGSRDRELSTSSQSPSILRRKRNFLPKVVGINRRISCKDLGGGDCQGWLWKKKEASGLRTGRWIKFWFVLHQKSLFYYKDPEDTAAKGAIHLIGFRVSPSDSHFKKFTFKAHKSDTTFFFAAERQDDMIKWMNKIGLASLPDLDVSVFPTTAGFVKPDRSIYEHHLAYFSESEDEVISVSASHESGKGSSGASGDILEFYQHFRQASIRLSMSFNKKDKGSSLLRGMSPRTDPQEEKCRQLLSLKRTLKDKQDKLAIIDEFLLRSPITSGALHAFLDLNPEVLTNHKMPTTEDDESSTSCSDS